jgi:hypothetical protein
MVMLPAGVSQVSYLDLETFLELRTFVEDKLGIECAEKFFY